MGLPSSASRETTRPVTALHAIGDGAEAAAAGGGSGSVDAALTKAARTGGLGSGAWDPRAAHGTGVDGRAQLVLTARWTFASSRWPMTVNWRCPGFDGGELVAASDHELEMRGWCALGYSATQEHAGLPGTTSPGGNL